MLIATLDSRSADFPRQLERLLERRPAEVAAVEEQVREIIRLVREEGDAALLFYSSRFDGLELQHAASLEVPPASFRRAWDGLPKEQADALECAASRLREYHQHQLTESWEYTDAAGTLLGQRISPVDRAGIYVPGGKAAYPSSVLMNAIPAKVAGVGEVIMVAPAPGGELSPMVLAAAQVAGVDRLFTLGGAQAIAALAYGTASIPAVDVIVGPGNQYVAAAKRQVFGAVGIDMLAGPSEILIICDGHTEPDWVVLDLFAQAEHDEQARALLVSPDADFLDAIKTRIGDLLGDMHRSRIIGAALREHGALIKVADLEEAVELANRLAPEHLELSVANPEALLPKVRNAGAVFLGRYTAEAVGDYCAGPNHVLPTAGTARFSSPLGVYHFQKRTSIIRCSASSSRQLGAVAAVLARGEGLHAHALSAEARCSARK